MWQKENSEEKKIIPEDLQTRYDKILKKPVKDNNIYLYLQIFFMAVMIVTAFMLKTGDSTLFRYAKEGYADFFEKNDYTKNNFSYEKYTELMEKEISEALLKLKEVYYVIQSRGKSTDIPTNVSTEKYRVEKRGILPAVGYVSSSFGVRKDPFNKKNKDFHTGIDIANSKGSFVKASFSGKVIDCGYSNIAGNYIKVAVDDEITNLYAHNQFLLVKTGDKILQGQVIATMADTGRRTGPHVHFEFSVNGIKYNPVYCLEI